MEEYTHHKYNGCMYYKHIQEAGEGRARERNRSKGKVQQQEGHINEAESLTAQGSEKTSAWRLREGYGRWGGHMLHSERNQFS